MNQSTFDVAIIGGGASGFFSACKIKEYNPNLKVCILEKSNKVLSKVKISGGGRCNLTHAIDYNSELVKHYPNGKNFLKKVFQKFTVKDTIQWFAQRGVKTKVEEDGRMFPVSDNSQSIIDTLIKNSVGLGVDLRKSFDVKHIHKDNGLFHVTSRKEDVLMTSKLIIATGGYPKPNQFDWLVDLGHSINLPVPSLFTFNIPVEGLKHLMGLSVRNAKVQIVGEKLNYSGPLLITHWGLSGPAVLKLSAWGARLLNARDYQFEILVNWIGELSEQEIVEQIKSYKDKHPKRSVNSNSLFEIPQRLWGELMKRAQIDEKLNYADIGDKSINRMLEVIFRLPLKVSGKTTFKEEFVTSGGIYLNEVDNKSMQSKLIENLYFTGEVLDIDGITGGFNFQAAWSTATVAAEHITAINERD